MYSIKALEGEHRGKVIGYAKYMHVTNPEFVVYQAGRRRVLETKKKNVHAGIIGDVDSLIEYEERLPTNIHLRDTFFSSAETPIAVTYNPYKYSTFVDRETEKPVRKGWLCTISGPKIHVYGVTA